MLCSWICRLPADFQQTFSGLDNVLLEMCALDFQSDLPSAVVVLMKLACEVKQYVITRLDSLGTPSLGPPSLPPPPALVGQVRQEICSQPPSASVRTPRDRIWQCALSSPIVYLVAGENYDRQRGEPSPADVQSWQRLARASKRTRRSLSFRDVRGHLPYPPPVHVVRMPTPAPRHATRWQRAEPSTQPVASHGPSAYRISYLEMTTLIASNGK